jgi:hypothetical protein
MRPSKSPKPRDAQKPDLTQKLAPLDEYVEAQPALHMVRIMNRFEAEVLRVMPGVGPFYAELHVAYMEILNEELSSYALNLALAITELEDAYPEIGRDDE